MLLVPCCQSKIEIRKKDEYEETTNFIRHPALTKITYKRENFTSFNHLPDKKRIGTSRQSTLNPVCGYCWLWNTTELQLHKYHHPFKEAEEQWCLLWVTCDTSIRLHLYQFLLCNDSNFCSDVFDNSRLPCESRRFQHVSVVMEKEEV